MLKYIHSSCLRLCHYEEHVIPKVVLNLCSFGLAVQFGHPPILPEIVEKFGTGAGLDHTKESQSVNGIKNLCSIHVFFFCALILAVVALSLVEILLVRFQLTSVERNELIFLIHGLKSHSSISYDNLMVF